MPIQAKPLFRADVLKPKLDAFRLPSAIVAKRQAVTKWRDLIGTAKIDKYKETEILPDFISELFQDVLGYHSLVQNPDRYTIRRENLIAVDGKRADAAFGVKGDSKFLAVLEGKGPLDPLDRPFGSRKMSAVENARSDLKSRILACDIKCKSIDESERILHPSRIRYTMFNCFVRAKKHLGADLSRLSG